MSSYDLLMPGLIAKTGVVKEITLLSSGWEPFPDEDSPVGYVYSYKGLPREEVDKDYSVIIVPPSLYKDNEVSYKGIEYDEEENPIIKFFCPDKPKKEDEEIDIDVSLLIVLKSTSKLESLEIEGDWPEDEYQYTNDWYNIKGMKFWAHYSSGTKVNVTPHIKIGKWDSNVGNQIATFSYSDGVISLLVEKSFNNVVRKLVSINVKTLPTTYQWSGNKPNITGLILEAKYNNNSDTKEITGETEGFSYEPEKWGKHSRLQTFTFYYTENGITVKCNYNVTITPKPEDIFRIGNIRTTQFYPERVDFTEPKIVVRFSDDGIKIFRIDNSSEPGTVEETEVHFIGGNIYYIDETATGAEYTFYNENGEIINDPYSATFYSISGSSDKDKYYVYDNVNLLDLLDKKNEWGYYSVNTGCNSDIGKKNYETIQEIGNELPRDSIWDFIINTQNRNNVNGCSDWYIGSSVEIDNLISYFNSIGEPLIRNVWSSKENDNTKSLRYDTNSNSWDPASKNDLLPIIPIRSF